MRVTVNNLLNATQYVDVKGLGEAEDIVTIGARSRAEVTLSGEKRFNDLKAERQGKLTFRKI